MRRQLMAACLGLLVASVAVLASQQAATLVLKSGQQLSGELVDLGAGFTFRVNGQDRDIPRNDVASIDFGGGAADVPDQAKNLPAGSNLIVLRNGEMIQGEFYDVNGAQPIRLTVRTSTGERVIQGGDVRRIYMARPEGATAASTASTSGSGKVVTVSARTAWTNTGITVRQGQTVRFSSSGEIHFTNRGDRAVPAGSPANLFDKNAPLPTALQGALIARIGAGQTRLARAATGGSVLLIGDQERVVMPADGQLFLGINDSGLNDNRGEYKVEITAE